ncbi:MAG: hypothetical protein V4792_05285 [Pseudomonadota bacterium]
MPDPFNEPSEEPKMKNFNASPSALVAAFAVLAVCAAPADAGGPNSTGTSSGGVVTIDQAKAIAGGVTNGDTAGFPVTLSEPGTYRLTGNLTLPNANTTGILISAANVTLDLGGYAVVGPVVCSGTPLVCNSSGYGDGVEVRVLAPNARATVTVMNGTLRGMGRHGLISAYDGVGGLRIERVMAAQNASAGLFVSSGAAVLDSQVSYNGGHGIAGNNLLLGSNVIRGNAGTGVHSNASSVGVHNLIQFNTLSVSAGGMRNLGPNWCDTVQCP